MSVPLSHPHLHHHPQSKSVCKFGDGCRKDSQIGNRIDGSDRPQVFSYSLILKESSDRHRKEDDPRPNDAFILLCNS